MSARAAKRARPERPAFKFHERWLDITDHVDLGEDYTVMIDSLAFSLLVTREKPEEWKGWPLDETQSQRLQEMCRRVRNAMQDPDWDNGQLSFEPYTDEQLMRKSTIMWVCMRRWSTLGIMFIECNDVPEDPAEGAEERNGGATTRTMH